MYKTHRNRKLGEDQSPVYNKMLETKCSFLFTTYPLIYKGIIEESLDMVILYKFVDVLKKIEDFEINQHEGSFLIGKLLKGIYIDKPMASSDPEIVDSSVIDVNASVDTLPYKTLSWKEYKKINL
jgi:hypothetical protein